MLSRRFSVAGLALLLTACAGHVAQPVSAPKPVWAFQKSDLPLDPAFRFGRLDNGLRFIVRRNATPPGTASVRLEVATGSLDEGPRERGFAHYVEHMAFNGSTHVPEGEMVKLLERSGLAFGADTNAHTGFEQTLYQLDLPRNDPTLLDTALMLMRETASELTFDPAAVSRERGVVLSELRDGRGYGLDAFKDQLAFLYPKARYPQRLPIGTPQALDAATPATLRAFWARGYVPANATVIVVGDFDADAVEAAIRARFASWKPAPPAPRPAAGPVLPRHKGRTDVWIDPALSERVTISRHGAWLDEPDTMANRRVKLLRQIGYGVINRRLLRTSRLLDPPFRGAGLGTSAVFRVGRTTNLVVDVADGGWEKGLSAAAQAYAQALAGGFTDAEVAEQVANVRAGLENAAAASATRGNGALVATALSLLRDDMVPTTPEGVLERFTAFAPQITPAAVLAALESEAVPLDAPLIRFQGRTAPTGGAKALRAAWDNAVHAAPVRTAQAAPIRFAYTDFGPAGTVVADRVEPGLGIRELRFANGVRLNLKRTTLEADRAQLRISIDGGELLETKADPLAVDMIGMLPAGGLGKHTQDELQTVLAGHLVNSAISASGDAFTQQAATTRRDLELQLQVMAALVTDPGYRTSAETVYRQSMSNFFARYRATPAAALGNALGGILTDDDPRFTLQPPQDYQRQTFAKLKAAIGDRMAHGAIEIGIVGDIDEAAAIAAVARTFGALPAREPNFRAYAAERERAFTARRGLAVVRHGGDAHQAIVRLVWPATDDSDSQTSIPLQLLQEVTEIEVQDTVREALGKSYSPSAFVALSRVWRGWGTFSINAPVDVADVPATRAAIAGTVRTLRDAPLDPDVLRRARAPMLEQIDNALKGNGGWLALAAQAQSQPERIDRYLKAKARLEALTAADVQAAARRWLTPGGAVEVLVLPDGVPAPAQ